MECPKCQNNHKLNSILNSNLKGKDEMLLICDNCKIAFRGLNENNYQLHIEYYNKNN